MTKRISKINISIIFLVKIKYFIKHNKINIAYIFICYLAALFSLILANINYGDDLERNIYGYFEYIHWSRYGTEILARILSLNNNFFLNLYPLSIFLSILLLSLSSCILAFIINKKLDSKILLLASVAIGLSPFYLENLSWKYDNPFMTLSVFCSIFPFLFLKNTKLFIIISILSLVLMFITYQASSGIYIIICMYLAYKEIIDKNYKASLNIIIVGAISYLVAAIIFKTIYNPQMLYVSSEILPFEYLFKGVMKNITIYVSNIYNDIGGGQSKVLLSLLSIFSITFIIKNTYYAKINKILAFFLSIITLSLIFILSYGVYIILIMPLFLPRAFIGFGIFMAIIALDSSTLINNRIRKIFIVLTLIFAWQLISFASAYGQALKTHTTYQDFRFILLANDLAPFLKDSDKNKDGFFNIISLGFAGYSPGILNLAKQYPIIKGLIPIIQSNYNGAIYTLKYYGIKAIDTPLCKSVAKNKQVMLKDNYYHSISKVDVIDANNESKTCYFITFKDRS